MGAGVRLNTGFLKNVELHERDKSVIVDEFMRSASGVFCAGDIARFPYQLSTSGVEFTRIEHWSVAQNQGRIAAQNLLGKRIPYSQTPFFWTVQFPGNLRYVGHAFNFDDVVVDGNPEKDGKFVAYFILKDEIKAVATLGRDPVAAAASELFRMKKMPGAAEVRSSNLDLVGMLSAMQK